MKVGNGQSQGGGMDAMPQPPMDTTPMPQGDMMGGGVPMDNSMPPAGNTDAGGAMPPMDNGQSEFDTNFDAGVEADEDTDPEKYIQQLTGKLSTTLNSFNSENGDNSGLNKYVAKMIVKAATKDMDDASKKEIIKAINTSENPELEDEPETEPMDDMGNDAPDVQGQDMQGMETPMQERVISKKQLAEMAKRYKK